MGSDKPILPYIDRFSYKAPKKDRFLCPIEQIALLLCRKYRFLGKV